MTALIIIAAIIIPIVIICNIPVEAYIRFYGGKPDIKVRYFFIGLYPRKEKPPKKSRKPKDKSDKLLTEQETPSEKASPDDEKNVSAKEDEPSPEKEMPSKKKDKLSKEEKPSKEDKPPDKNDPEEKPSFLEKINNKLDELTEKKNQISLLLELVVPHLKKFGRKLRIDDILIDFAAADEDAAKAAISYGRLGGAVYNAIAFLRQFVSMSIISVNISCLYNTPADKSRFDGECKLRLRPASLINAVLAVCFGYITNTKKYSPVMELFKKG